MNTIKYKLKGDLKDKYRYMSRETFEALETLDAIELYCYNNKLTSLPELPVCEILVCSFNRLTNLPELTHCEKLNCSNNKLTSLPELPVCEILVCSFNKLTNLPELSVCKELRSYFNPLPLYYPRNTKDISAYNNLINTIKTLQARFLLKQVLKGCPWHPLGKKHISKAWEKYEKTRSK